MEQVNNDVQMDLVILKAAVVILKVVPVLSTELHIPSGLLQ
jgi:hypothetical protein